MTTLEIILAAASPVLLAAGGGIAMLVKRHLEGRERVELAQIDADSDVVKEIFGRLDLCEEERKSDRAECKKEIASVSRKYEERIEQIEARLTPLVRRVRQLHDPDSTGAHELAALEEEQPRTMRVIPPPPRRRRETRDDG